jgi:hypothetical protein
VSKAFLPFGLSCVSCVAFERIKALLLGCRDDFGYLQSGQAGPLDVLHSCKSADGAGLGDKLL